MRIRLVPAGQRGIWQGLCAPGGNYRDRSIRWQREPGGRQNLWRPHQGCIKQEQIQVRANGAHQVGGIEGIPSEACGKGGLREDRGEGGEVHWRCRDQNVQGGSKHTPHCSSQSNHYIKAS